MAIRILIVDDSEDDAAVIDWTLRKAGIDAECTRVDTTTALEAALSDPRGWSVILCDYRIPRLHAARALDTVHRALPSVPVLLVCGAYPPDLWHELGSGMINRFVCKDRLAELPAAIRAILPADAPAQAISGH